MSLEIKTASFVVSNSDYRKCPSNGLPEFAFIGRSNVGKSSLINMLCQCKDLAKTSGKPGKTQLINHFLVNNTWYIVDLPGYGYARVAKTSRNAWQKMISDYFIHRETLVNTFVLVDSRLTPQAIDLQFLSFLGSNNIPLSVIFTKTDKLGQRETAKNISLFKQEMLTEWEELPPMFLTSSKTGYGRASVLDYIDSMLD